eukprot:GHVS01056545.1.p1 GENE.GHVS01056545.1~~GHVS01056545.1.p1  ORF type:complete len:356 (+),score=46.67 GHVS01056545.1:226-1293(+)
MPSSPLAPSYDRDTLLQKEGVESLLKDNPARWVILPIKFPVVWNMFKKHEHDFWTGEQVVDQFSWSPADSPNQEVAVRMLSAEVGSKLFSSVMEWNCGLLEHTTSPEARAFYGFECAFTTMHYEALSLLQAKAPTSEDVQTILKQIPCESSAVNKKHRWIASTLSQENLPFAEKLLIHALFKSVMNASRCLLCALLHKNGQLPAVESVFRRLTETERLHAQFAGVCYSLIENALPAAYVSHLVEQCVMMEHLYAVEIFGTDAQAFNLTADLLKLYIQHVGNSVLSAFRGTKTTSGTFSNVFADIMKIDCCTVPPLPEASPEGGSSSGDSADNSEDQGGQTSQKLSGTQFNTECDF